ncbi:hypothetical protein LTR70_000592 [Exophiala xenobiotica]|uniref:Heterokaryon incompatibility domain-containing protein n=1 Tax=Lithohypha guttulata TaxID=1690604 RepID=A0ABR0KIP8_9EURO|nr:hypothetical protein LTR24_002161 [Lithohypha guttulata]KAK5329443.1 hypothetical protein LTR70_000592 [Exophiala xenobiotica]
MELIDQLCPQCEAADPLSLFEGVRSEEGDDYQAVKARTKTVKTLSELRNSQQCPFCRLMLYAINTTLEGGLIRPEPETKLDPDRTFCVLRPCRADLRDCYSFDDPEVRSAVATVLEVRLEAAEDDDKDYALEVSAWMPWTSIKLCGSSAVPSRPLLNARDPEELDGSAQDITSWLEECETHHAVCSLFASAHVPDVPFYLIDVKSSKLVQANFEDPSLVFAALSYVWGHSAQAHADVYAAQFQSIAETSMLPKELPRTIQDAMQICHGLGMQYLWVDLYCIEQANFMIRADQIQAMDVVYGRARVVLIAARGEHVDVGISRYGTPSTFRYPPKTEVVLGRKLATTPPSSTLTIDDSPWAMRAWTLQEGLLARRCIIFDGRDTWFFCRSFQKRQTDHWPNDISISRPGHIRTSRSVPFMGCLPEAGKWLTALKWSFIEYDKLLRTYSARSMSRDSDTVNAVTGCLSLMARSQSVPFQNGLPMRDFVFALLWDRWWYDKRRTGFPSWSWAGWHAFQHGHIWRPINDNEATRMHDAWSSVGERDLASSHSAWVTAGSSEVKLHGDWFRVDDTEEGGEAWLARWPLIELEKVRRSSIGQSLLRIVSSMVRFKVVLRPGPNTISFGYTAHTATTRGTKPIPTDFGSESSHVEEIQENIMYSTPYDRIELQGQDGHNLELQHPGNVSSFKLNLPVKIFGSSLRRLLEEGVHLVRILDLEKVIAEHDGSKRVRHYVSCLIIRKNEHYWERFGSALLPIDLWEASEPQAYDVSIA